MPARAPAVPASPLRRTLTAAGSLLLLVCLVAGLPVALVGFAGNPLPSELPGADGIWSALTSRDDGSLLLSVIAVVGWLGWACFTGSVLLELFARLTRRAAPAIPGLAGPQRFAALLIAAIAAVTFTPTLTSTSAAVVASPPPAVAMMSPADSGADEHRVVGRNPAGQVVHVVGRGEALLDVAERYGVRWQRIAEANYGVTQPDGRSLQRGQTRIYPGWQLRVPTQAGPLTGAAGSVDPSTVDPAIAEPVISDPADDPFAAEPAAAQQDPWTVDPRMIEPQPAGPASVDPSTVDPRPADRQTIDPHAVDPGPAGAGASAAQVTGYEYVVAEGDWLWHISQRYLGDPQRYPEIAALNPELADRHGNFPDHIEPGWTIRLPADAEDSGPTRHATGTATPADAAGGPPPAAQVDPAPDATPDAADSAEAGPDRAAEAGVRSPEAGVRSPDVPEAAGFGAAAAGQAGPAQVGLGPAPDQPAADQPAADQPAGDEATGDDAAGDQPAADEATLERFAPAGFAGAGLLTAMLLGAAAAVRYRRHQHHRPGYRAISPAAQRLEKLLRSAQQPVDAARLDAALRQLASALAGRTSPLPDIAGALVDDGAVHLLLASACPSPPQPWRDHGDRWTLPAGVPVPEPAGGPGLAPLPTLTAVGSQAGIHLLLDLERQGFLTLHGDQHRAMDLLRYLAAELACHSWSDPVDVLLAGFPSTEVEQLLAIDPDRIRAVPSVAAAVTTIRQRAASARSALGHTGVGDAFAGRVHRIAGDAWMPQVLLVAADAADRPALAALEQELVTGTRCAVAVAVTGPADSTGEQPKLTLTPEGVVHVRLPYLHASLTAAGLTESELAQLATVMRAARTARQVPVPPAAEPWAVGADAAGAVRAVGRCQVGAPPAPAPAAPVVPATPAVLTVETDRRLDADLHDWYDLQVDRPRIGVLGPVMVVAAGTAPQTRRRLHTELVVFLAQRAAAGASDAEIEAALWPGGRADQAARQVVISRVRRWLGVRPDGLLWLPDVGADLGYRLADGYLCDWHLFRRLRARAQLRGPDGVGDLRQALRLVRGAPLADADQPSAPGIRNPYPWLAGSAVDPGQLLAAVVDTAHELAERCLAGGDPAGAKWAVRQAWLADPARGYDQPWRDLLRAAHADGDTATVRTLLAELMEARDAETPAELAPDTYKLVSTWPPGLLVPTG